MLAVEGALILGPDCLAVREQTGGLQERSLG